VGFFCSEGVILFFYRTFTQRRVCIHTYINIDIDIHIHMHIYTCMYE